MFGNRKLLGAVLVMGLAAAAGGGRALATTVRDALALSPGTEVVIQAALVERVIGGYVFVRDSWGPHQLLPVWPNAQIARGSSLEITGRLASVSGQAVVVATRLRLYVDANGRAMPPLWPGMGEDWQYLTDVPLGFAARSLDLPPVPELYTEGEDGEGEEGGDEGAPPAPAGSIQWAKQQPADATLTLENKVVTAIFTVPGTQTVDYFNIADINEDPADPSGPPLFAFGIRVYAQLPFPVEEGAVVTVRGTIVDGSYSGEAYLRAWSVICTGSHRVPPPMGMTGKSAAAGAFGRQPALYRTNAVKGCGTSAVGSLVRVCGRVTSNRIQGDYVVYYLDDGSGLRCTKASVERRGVGVIFPNGSLPNWTEGTFVQGVTGVLGAEMSDHTTPRPIPLVRVPLSTNTCVKYVGGSWPGSYGSIQSAIDAAYSANPKCEVWVAAGTYGSIIMKSGVNVYGGFAGNETTRGQRNWVTHPTILDGGGTTRPVTASSLSGQTRIDGFTIRNGRPPSGQTDGGGMSLWHAPVVVANCIFTNNTAQHGGGVELDTTAGVPTIWGCTFTGNSAYHPSSDYCFGGAIRHYHGGESYPEPVYIMSCTFTGNSSRGSGGAIDCHNAAVFDSIFTGNSAEVGGGGAIYSSTRITAVRSCRFHNNTALGGGAISTYYSDTFGGYIHNNLFAGNQATGSDLRNGGGAIATAERNGYGSTLAIASNTFVGNAADQKGGAILIGNSYLGDPHIRILNNIFCGNTATAGQSVYATRGENTVRFCDAWNSGAQNDAALHYCFAQNMVLTVEAASCIYLNPLFVGVEDYHLSLSPPTVSPCIDRCSSIGTEVPPFDLDGLLRPVDISTVPNYGPSAFADMGAYEAR